MRTYLEGLGTIIGYKKVKCPNCEHKLMKIGFLVGEIVYGNHIENCPQDKIEFGINWFDSDFQ